MSATVSAPYGSRLTPAEARVLEYSARGLSAAATGRALFMAVDTVKTHRRNIFSRLGARNITHAVALVLTSKEPPTWTSITPLPPTRKRP